MSIALKPTSSIVMPADHRCAGQPVEVSTTGRHDPCVGIRAVPIAEAMLALVLMDHYLRHRAQNADVRCATPVIPGSVYAVSRHGTVRRVPVSAGPKRYKAPDIHTVGAVPAVGYSYVQFAEFA